MTHAIAKNQVAVGNTIVNEKLNRYIHSQILLV